MATRQKQTLKQIIYTSKPVAFEENTIDEILASSHKYNSESGVPRLLIFGSEGNPPFLMGSACRTTRPFSVSWLV